VERPIAGIPWLSTLFRLGDSGDDSELHCRPVHSAGCGIWETVKLLLVLVLVIENENIKDENDDDPELNCLNAPDSPESKFTMKSNQFNSLCRALVLLATLLVFSADAQSFVISNAAPTAIPRRASIILIVADGLGYGDLSCDGQTNFQTPNLDKLAADGARFTNYSAGGAADLAADAALMLGKDPSRPRQQANAEIALAPDDVTVAQVLKNSGYHTGLIGDWNLGDENSSGAPWKKGFDEFAGYLDPKDAGNFYADYIFRYAPHTVLDTNNGPHFVGREMLYDNNDGKHGTYVPDLLTKAAINFVKDSQPDLFNHYRPFFLLLNYKIPGDGKYQVPTDAPFSEEPWPQPEKNKAAMIARLDDYIGQMQQQLGKLGITNNTAIFFTSDSISKTGNGIDPAFFHSNVSTNDFRVPMIVRWPAQIPAGLVSDFKWSARDFLPTAADIAFTKPPANIEGHSVLRVLLGVRK
jgi:arylsulfatase A-like enzyme